MNLLPAILFVFGGLFLMSIIYDKVAQYFGKQRKTESSPEPADNPPKAIVVAGSYFQFHQWCFEHGYNRDDYIYATEWSVQSHNLPIIRVGTWWEQSEELLTALRNQEIERER